jgi:hypothetical protein
VNTLDLHEVRQAFTTRIEALTPLSTYTHGSNDTWHESQWPLIPEWDPPALAHLAFFVDDRTTEDGGDSRNQSIPGGELHAAEQLVIRFLFECRTQNQIDDWDGAGKAAMHLVRHLVAESGDWPDPAMTVDPGSPVIVRNPIGARDWLSVEVRVRVAFHTSLAVET